MPDKKIKPDKDLNDFWERSVDDYGWVELCPDDLDPQFFDKKKWPPKPYPQGDPPPENRPTSPDREIRRPFIEPKERILLGRGEDGKLFSMVIPAGTLVFRPMRMMDVPLV